MKRIFTEKTIVVLLFLIVVTTFSLAQHDTRHLESVPTFVDPVAIHPTETVRPQQMQAKSNSFIPGVQ